jgi:hypothetical protein
MGRNLPGKGRSGYLREEGIRCISLKGKVREEGGINFQFV